MSIHLAQIVILAMIQGAAELLPVSSSAHVILVEKWMGLDPSMPELTFLLVMLHTGTMFAVMLHFWSRWRKLNFHFLKLCLIATAITGFLGLGLKKGIELFLARWMATETSVEVEYLFKNLPMIAGALFAVGLFMIYAGKRKNSRETLTHINFTSAIRIGMIQSLCLPFRGFSRSGATIATALLHSVSESEAEDFSFALGVLLTPPVILLQAVRLMKSSGFLSQGESGSIWALFGPGLLGMVFSFISGMIALQFLSRLLAKGAILYFGIYCIGFSGAVYTTYLLGF